MELLSALLGRFASARQDVGHVFGKAANTATLHSGTCCRTCPFVGWKGILKIDIVDHLKHQIMPLILIL